MSEYAFAVRWILTIWRPRRNVINIVPPFKNSKVLKDVLQEMVSQGMYLMYDLREYVSSFLSLLIL